jgi:CCR4-NOT transcription complex subunit 1
MTFPPPHPAAQNSIASNTNKNSSARPARVQPSAWGLPAPATGARRGLTPLATDLGSSSLEPTGRPTSTAPPFTSTFSSVLNSSSRNTNSRVTYSTPSTTSSFSPSQTGSQQTPQLLLSPRSRAITPSSNSYLASSAAASTTASQGGGGSGSGGGTQRNQTFSPSSQLQTLNSPTNNTFDRSAFGGSAPSSGISGQSSVSKIVVTQVFLLLGSITEKEGKAKWDSQAEAIHKVIQLTFRDHLACTG